MVEDQAGSKQRDRGGAKSKPDPRYEAGRKRFERAAKLTKEFLGIDVTKESDGWERGVKGALCAALFEALVAESVDESTLKQSLELVKAAQCKGRAGPPLGRQGKPGRGGGNRPTGKRLDGGSATLQHVVRELYGVTPFDGDPGSVHENGRRNAEVVQRRHDDRNQRENNG